MTREAFHAKLAAIRSENDAFAAALKVVLDRHRAFGCSMTEETPLWGKVTKTVAITESLRTDVRWQLTFFDEKGAIGHLDFNDFEDLARTTLGQLKAGYEPDPEFQLQWERQA